MNYLGKINYEEEILSEAALQTDCSLELSETIKCNKHNEKKNKKNIVKTKLQNLALSRFLLY